MSRDLSPTGRILKTIQNFYFHIFIAIYNELKSGFLDPSQYYDMAVACGKKEDLSHGLARCYLTRVNLNIFLSSGNFIDIPNFPDPDIASWDEYYNVNLMTISFGGPNFPDHTLVLLRTGDEFYILQSYYYAYLFTGKYGLIRLDKKEARTFLTLLRIYQGFAGRELTLRDISEINMYNKLLEKYTGIDTSKHFFDSKRNPKIKNHITIENKIGTYIELLLALRRNFEVLSELLEKCKEKLELSFQYQFFDAFSEGKIEGDIEKFELLVGHKYETGIEGIRTGFSPITIYTDPFKFSYYNVSYEILVPKLIVKQDLDILVYKLTTSVRDYHRATKSKIPVQYIP